MYKSFYRFTIILLNTNNRIRSRYMKIKNEINIMRTYARNQAIIIVITFYTRIIIYPYNNIQI